MWRRERVSPALVAIFSLPKVILYPVALLLFALIRPAKLRLAAVASCRVIVAVEAESYVYLSIPRIGRVLQLAPNDMGVRLLLSATLPKILISIRIGLALTIVGGSVGKIFGSNKAVGFMLTNPGEPNDLGVTALTVFVVVAAMAINWLVADASALSGYSVATIWR